MVDAYLYICSEPIDVSWGLGIWKWRGVVYIVFDSRETRSNVVPSPVCAGVGPEWLDWIQWMVVEWWRVILVRWGHEGNRDGDGGWECRFTGKVGEGTCRGWCLFL